MNALALYALTVLLGFFVFTVLIPHDNREFFYRLVRGEFAKTIPAHLAGIKSLAERGGYVHDTAMNQYIPPNLAHCVTGTWTDVAGQVAGTIVRKKAAAAETTTINIPIIIPSNSVAGKGSLLKSVEVDYEITGAAATSVTLSIVKVARGANTAVAVVSAPAGTQTLTAATTAATLDQHLDKFTLTTPAYIDDGEYYFLKIVAVCAAATVLEILGAVAQFTDRR